MTFRPERVSSWASYRRAGLLVAVLGAAVAAAAPGQAQQFKNLKACEGGGFSTEEDFMMTRGEPFDGNPYISDGDLLSPAGQVCARNRELLQAFGTEQDLGLDAADLLDFERGLVAFSTELDDPRGAFGAGDVLLTNGGVIPNAALLAPFGISHDVGLDEVKFAGRPEAILRFADEVRNIPREAPPERVLTLLKDLQLEIWFSIEGSVFRPERPVLDGDILSTSGAIITNRELLTPGAPGGLPAEGVDFGIDAFAIPRDFGARDKNIEEIFFSTEILFRGRPGFNDGDVLRHGPAVFATNQDLIAAFAPRADFLGLDALSLPFGNPPGDPRITTMCDLNVGEFNGGIVPVGGGGTGLHEDAIADPGALVPVLERPCGRHVPANGPPPDPSSVQRFRVVYREVSEPVPATGDPATPAIQTVWNLKRGTLVFVPMIGLVWSCEIPAPLSTDAQGWMNAADFMQALTGTGSYIGCSHPELRLAVWNTLGLPPGTPDGFPVAGHDREDHYVLWLEWEDTSAVLHREGVDHHLQLDNTLPVIAPHPDGLQLRLADGTPVPNCGEAPAGENLLQVWGQFDDRYYDSFSLVLKGGEPPAAAGYGPHRFYDPIDGTAGVKNTNDTGTMPDATTVHLRNIDMTDLGASFTDCCYYLEMRVFDRSIRHTFDGVFVNDFVGGNHTETFMTFSAAP